MAEVVVVTVEMIGVEAIVEGGVEAREAEEVVDVAEVVRDDQPGH